MTTTFKQLLATGWTPPADDEHDDLFAPIHESARERIRGSFVVVPSRTAGYERSR